MQELDPRRARVCATAEDYERRRPAYPAEAVDWMLPPGAGPDPKDPWEHELARLDPDTAGRDLTADPGDDPMEVPGLPADELEERDSRGCRRSAARPCAPGCSPTPRSS
ncbi:MAG TPA: hypothetical protein VI357_24300 [Mycobacteriales bacterium]